MQNCLAHVKSWMSQNFLKLNDDKTEILVVSTRPQLHKMEFPSISVGHACVKPATEVRNLGVVFDSKMNMEAHVNSVCKSCYYYLFNIARIRKFLTKSTAETMIHSLISTRLDYCNSLLSGACSKLFARLQRVQNSAARIVSKVPKTAHVTPILKNLHWLPVSKRVEYRILLLTFNILNSTVPEYLSSLLYSYKPVRELRSSSQQLLFVPKSKLKLFGDHAFSVLALGSGIGFQWKLNQLPHLNCLKGNLKHFFLINIIISEQEHNVLIAMFYFNCFLVRVC